MICLIDAIAALLCGLHDTHIEQWDFIFENIQSFLFYLFELKGPLFERLSCQNPCKFKPVNPGKKRRTGVNGSKAVVVGVKHLVISPGLKHAEADLAVTIFPLAALGFASDRINDCLFIEVL